MKQVWITGAHGFIGRYLARHLQKKGCQVAGLGHGIWPDAEARQWGISYWLNGDVTAANLSQMKKVLGEPNVIYHLAGGSSVGAAIAAPLEDFTRTVVSTAELLEWMRQYSESTALVAVSSAAVYGSEHQGNIVENASLKPFSPYGSNKLMMEEACRSYAANYGIHTVLPRLFSVYGQGLKKQLLWDLCSKFLLGGQVELGGTGNELRNWIDVRDVAHALDLFSSIADETAPVINLAAGSVMSVREVANLVAEKWEKAGNHRPEVTFSGRSRPGDPFSLVADVGQMQRAGVRQHITHEQGLSEYVDWFLSQAGKQG